MRTFLVKDFRCWLDQRFIGMEKTPAVGLAHSTESISGVAARNRGWQFGNIQKSPL
jgi:hypothetical protein